MAASSALSFPPITAGQYTSRDVATLCGQLGVRRSMGAVGSSADNALAESFNATLRRETLTAAASWPDQAACQRAIFRWATRDNTRRHHSYCNYMTPVDYENRVPATLPKAA